MANQGQVILERFKRFEDIVKVEKEIVCTIKEAETILNCPAQSKIHRLKEGESLTRPKAKHPAALSDSESNTVEKAKEPAKTKAKEPAKTE